MRRIHLFEFLDLPWYPDSFRRIQTDYLQFAATRGSGQKNLVPLIRKALRHAGTTEIVDLCSGGSGPWLNLQRELAEAGCAVSVKLTDKYPNPEDRMKEALQRIPFRKGKPGKTLIEPVPGRRLSAVYEQKRLDDE